MAADRVRAARPEAEVVHEINGGNDAQPPVGPAGKIPGIIPSVHLSRAIGSNALSPGACHARTAQVPPEPGGIG